ncbi:DeoR/GlpR family DNA-binding transcription regulator [Marinobacter sp. F3R08]|uniref:DeoR/GlpR family DNA-binding transcription regulator n=1 Tax=Marinobacter sp. F3R08 TaxID=2841559 RepID=UPI001C088AD2|nr:DeoR/GlpR family DNA-binding transcription regulator [Marinobacter sp. F3R08]MBU2952613.1 DeoR/GlpR family DNA-binding transcription regulator [Marinobacter sp. F3R08]
MGAKDRQQSILEWVHEQKHVEVEDIANRFGVTTQTVRRDINKLCEQGLLRRRYGGVSLPANTATSAPGDAQVRYLHAKQQMARRVAADIPEGATVSLGVGSTVELVAQALIHHHRLRILTNNLSVAAALSGNPGIEVIVSGGHYRHQHHDVVGPEVTSFFSSFITDFGIISTGSMDPQHGLMDYDIREAEVSRAIIANTRTRLLVADHSKWSTNSHCKIASFRYVDRFYTDTLSDETLQALPGALNILECGKSTADVA